MFRIRKIGILLLMTMSSVTNAGFNGLTHHSRANCANNETISWDWTTDHLLKTVSLHTPIHGLPKDEHVVVDDWRTTWRSAAVHWGEGHGGWHVYGQHWMMDKKGKEYLAQDERVSDCSIYDGWWDKNK